VGSSGDQNAQGRVAAANGWIAWTESAPSRSGIRIYDIAAGTSVLVPAMVRRISNLAVANGVVAWWQGQNPSNSQPPRIIVHDSGANSFQTVAASGVIALVLSGDGQTLVWLQDSSGASPGLFAHDLKTGSGGRLLGGQSIGVSLSVSGPYVSWQPGPGSAGSTGGVYNVKTHELRLVQVPGGATPRLSRVLGQWFFWSDGATPGATPAGGPSSGCCFLLRLAS